MNNLDQNKTSNRNFGITFFIFFLILSLYPLIQDKNINYVLLFISIIFLFLSFLKPKVLKPLNKIWFKFGIFLGKFVSPIVMSLIFFLVITPTGLIMKVIGKNLLNLKNENKKTYWINKDNSNNSMKNQF